MDGKEEIPFSNTSQEFRRLFKLKRHRGNGGRTAKVGRGRRGVVHAIRGGTSAATGRGDLFQNKKGGVSTGWGGSGLAVDIFNEGRSSVNGEKGKGGVDDRLQDEGVLRGGG